MIPPRSRYALKLCDGQVYTRLVDGGIFATLHTVRGEDNVLGMYSVQGCDEVVPLT